MDYVTGDGTQTPDLKFRSARYRNSNITITRDETRQDEKTVEKERIEKCQDEAEAEAAGRR